MDTLAKKLGKELDDRGIKTFRDAEKAMGISHSTIQQVVNNGRTGLTSEVRNKIISFSKEITIADFTPAAKKGAKKKSQKIVDKDISALLEKYKMRGKTYADELREQYLS